VKPTFWRVTLGFVARDEADEFVRKQGDSRDERVAFSAHLFHYSCGNRDKLAATHPGRSGATIFL